jgi:L-iditol 2-dehydrogenase
MIKKGKAAILDKPNGEFTIDEAELPEPKEGEALVKQEMCGVCGTDAHMYHGHLPGTSFPIVLGHEVVGIIDKLGKGVKTDHTGETVKEGDRLYIVPGLRCRKCYFCTVLSEPTLCVNSTAYGFRPYLDQPPHFQGGYAEYIYMNHPASTFLKMHVPPEIAVLLEPLTVGIHQVDKVKLHVGDTAVIQGCGAIGLFTLVAAKEAGAHKTIVIGAPKSRLDLAKEFGADLTINIEEVPDEKERIEMVKSETVLGYGADVVFECTGFKNAIPEGIDMLRRGGSYVVAGHFTDVGNVSLNPFVHFTNKQINLVGVLGNDIVHFVRGRPILESGKYPFEKMVSHKLPLEGIKNAIDAISTNYRLDDKEVRKIVIAT